MYPHRLFWGEQAPANFLLEEYGEQIAGTPAVTLAGLMAQVEFLRDINVNGELWPDWNAIVAGIKNIANSSLPLPLSPLG